MCTVTWQHRDSGYLLLCNRDEKRSRKPALGPRNFTRGGVRFVAPRDGDFGGSWISTNQFGLSLCLLNAYPEGVSAGYDIGGAAPYRSRGLLLFDLAACSSLDQINPAISSKDLTAYSPFTLLALAPASPALVMDWNGNSLKTDRNADFRMPLTSSSVADAAAAAARTHDFFERGAYVRSADFATLLGFHASHHPARGAHSACMHRDDAETVSLSMISVGPGATHFWYHPAPPCQEAPLESITLLRDKVSVPNHNRVFRYTKVHSPLPAGIVSSGPGVAVATRLMG